MKIRPLDDRVMVKPIEPAEVKKGGIIIPDTAKERPMHGEVKAVGTGHRMEDGKVSPMTVKVGDKILYGKYSGTEISVDGEDLLIMRESDVMAIVE